MTQRMYALAHALGLVLFDRDTGRCRPTPEAMALIETAQAIENAVGDFSRMARQLTVGKTHSIRIMGVKDALHHRFFAVIKACAAKHSDSQFKFMASGDNVGLMHFTPQPPP